MSSRIGRIWLQGPDGRVCSTVMYDAPPQHRHAVLQIQDAIYQAAHQMPNGTWVYRYERRAPTVSHDRDLKDFRNDQHPQWDGPVIDTTPATWNDVQQHFINLMQESSSRSHGLTHQELQDLYTHFIAAKHGHACGWKA